ncbi:MAG: tripartite tricarboxylate transporter substrate binding protein [Betaproteobacteria bacterium]
MTNLSRRSLIQFATSATALQVSGTFAQTQSWPSGPIRVIVPFTAGSVTDVAARVVGQPLGTNLGQAIVIENRVGANGIIGCEYAAKSVPNGYTLLLGGISTNALNPSFYPKLPYDEKSFIAISQIALTPNIVVVNAASPIYKMKDFVALAKSQGNVNYATAGVGSGPHLCGELIKMLGGIQMTAIPYKGAPESFTAVLSNEVSMTLQSITSTLPLIRGGKLRPIAVTSSERSSLFPDLPTLAEEGFSGYNFSSWSGIYAPTGTPVDVIAKLSTELIKATKSEEVQRTIGAQGGKVVASTPEQFAAFTKSEIAKWGKVIREANIKID